MNSEERYKLYKDLVDNHVRKLLEEDGLDCVRVSSAPPADPPRKTTVSAEADDPINRIIEGISKLSREEKEELARRIKEDISI